MPLDIFKRGVRTLQRQSAGTVARTIGDLGVNAISPVKKQPQLAYMWEVVFWGANTLDQSIDKNADMLYFQAVSTGLPEHTMSRITRYHQGIPYDYPGKDASPRTLSITFWDNQDLDAYHYFQRWMYLLNDPVGSRQSRWIARNVDIKLKDSTDLFIVERFRYGGCWPFNISEPILSYESNEQMNFTVQFSFIERLSG